MKHKVRLLNNCIILLSVDFIVIASSAVFGFVCILLIVLMTGCLINIVTCYYNKDVICINMLCSIHFSFYRIFY